jgi:hypothetical protein
MRCYEFSQKEEFSADCETMNPTLAVSSIGCASLGIVIGWLVRFFLYRMKSFTPKALSSIVSIVAGGAAIRFLEHNSGPVWWYTIGLLLGFIIYSVVGAIARTKEIRPTDAEGEMIEARRRAEEHMVGARQKPIYRKGVAAFYDKILYNARPKK